ncbi:MAG TPA: efflux transporter outer membrane subunit [Opitutaceae bacterium]|jgi:multidrug efflux system outer membrane protein
MSAAARACLAAAGVLLGGCAVGPNYERPATNPPAAFRGSAGGSAASDLAWWDVYRDPALSSLVRSALANGYDARIAASRVLESRAIASEVHGQLFPGVGYAGNADRGRNAVLGNAFPGGTASAQDGFDAYLGAAWEFDLWGRVRRLDEAARAQYLATQDASRGVRLSLESDVATAYYELLELDDELAIEKSATESFGESLRLFNLQLQGGTASRLDSASAEAAMESSRARIPALEMQIEEKENQISVLIGANPGPIARGATLPGEPAPPDIPAGIPSGLLERRPDVRQAEEAARAANAGIGVTIGGFLPRIGLSAVLGGVSTQLDQITTHGSQLWSVGANVTGPLFQGGSLHGQYDAAKERWEEAKLQYQQAALSAFGDVANALVARQKLAEARASQERAVKAYEEAVTLSTERYKAGRASYYEVIQSQLLLFPAQVTLAQTRRDQFLAVVQLYQALGGGWTAEGGAPAGKP